MDAEQLDSAQRQTLHMDALTQEQLAAVLAKSGSVKATVATIQADIEKGAPVNGDGTINLIHFMAWAVRELAHGE